MQQSEWRSSTCLKNYESLSCNEIHGMFMWKVKKKEGEEYKIEFIIHKKGIDSCLWLFASKIHFCSNIVQDRGQILTISDLLGELFTLSREVLSTMGRLIRESASA